MNEKKKTCKTKLLPVILIIFIIAAVAYPKCANIDNIFTYASQDKVVKSYDTTKNVPEFYGLTKAVVQKDSEFDIKSAHLRIFARDVEDGDLTYKIVVKSNNVDTANIGNYEIVYEVTDSDNNFKTITVPVEVVENDEGAYYERTVYSLPSVDHMAVTGPRGNKMDKQITGLMLRPNAKIRMKKVSGPNVVAQIYSTNEGTKGDRTLTDSWQNISYGNLSTVFMKTSFKVNGPTVIAINVPEGENVIEMPYYHYKDDEAKFREYWNSIEGGAVGVIENQSVLFYFLPQDKNNFKNFGTIDAGLEFFDRLMDEYDELLGYDYVADNPWDQNVKTKYFISGGGANNGALAYYSEAQVTWAGSNTPTGNAFAVGWASLHEIAHGYQGGGLKEDGGMGLVEVSNNILGHYIQVRSDIRNQVPGDWLGSLSSIEEGINGSRLNGTKFRGLGPKQKLYVLVNLLETYDYKETYAHLASMVRELNYKGQGSKYNLAEKYTLTFHELYGVNVAPYFESWGESISQDVKELVKNDKIATTIKDVVVDDAKSTEIKTDLGKSGKYSLVTPEELAKYNLEGDLTLKLEIDDFDEISGKEIVISNGVKTYTEKITKPEINLTLPIGNYQITTPVPKHNTYTYSTYCNVGVKNGTNTEFKIAYKDNVDNVLNLDTEIYLYGQMLYSYPSYGTIVNVKFTDKNIIVRSCGGFTHVGWQNQSYVKVEVRDLEDNVVYSLNYNGGNTYAGSRTDYVPYEVGYKIVVYHAEGKNRLNITHRITATASTNLTKVNGTNTYIIGEYGLYQTEDSYEIYKNRIDQYAQKLLKELSAEEIADKRKRNVEKGALLTGIYKLNELDMKEYLQKYLYIYNGSGPVLSNESVTLKVGDDTSLLYQQLKGNDLEDGEFTLNSSNFVFAEFSTEKAQDISTDYVLKDLDDNETSGTLSIKIEENEEEAKPVESTEVKPASGGADKSAGNAKGTNETGIKAGNTAVTEASDSDIKPDDSSIDKPAKVAEETRTNTYYILGAIGLIFIIICIIVIVKIYKKIKNQ